MKKSLKIVFFGNEKIATGIEASPIIFDALVKSKHEVVALVIHASAQKSRVKKTEPITSLALEHKVPIFNPDSLKDIHSELKALRADIGILVAYGKLVPVSCIDIFPLGILNVHPSLLPQLRGSTPIESAILQGLHKTGVSIMRIAQEMDAGNILAQQSVELTGQETKQDLAHSLHNLGSSMLTDCLDQLMTGSPLHEVPQNESEATYCSRISKQEGLLDPSQSAVDLERQIRAYHKWPGSWFMHKGKKYIVTKARAEQSNSTHTGVLLIHDNSLGLQTSKGVLVIESIQPEGKKEMPIKAFLNGYQTLL